MRLPHNSLQDRLARSGLPAGDLAFINEAVTRSSSIVEGRKNILEEQDDCERIVVVLEGWACKFRMLSDGRRQIGQIHLAGDVCNLDALAGRPVPFGVLALTSCLVTSMPRLALLEAMEQRPALRMILLSMLIDENQVMNDHIVNLGRRSARERTAHLLLKLLLRLQENGEALDGTIRCALTQADMADYLGLSSVHTNRALKDLKDNGLIGGRGNRYCVIDRTKLQALASF